MLVRVFRWLGRVFGRGQTVRARAFVLEDDRGNEKAALHTDRDDNVVLAFRDGAGASRLFIGLTPEGTPRVGLKYAEGKGSIQIEANDRLSTAGIIMAGPNGKAQVLLGIARNGLPALALFDSDGQRVFPSGDSAGEDGAGPGFDWDTLLRG